VSHQYFNINDFAGIEFNVEIIPAGAKLAVVKRPNWYICNCKNSGNDVNVCYM